MSEVENNKKKRRMERVLLCDEEEVNFTINPHAEKMDKI